MEFLPLVISCQVSGVLPNTAPLPQISSRGDFLQLQLGVLDLNMGAQDMNMGAQLLNLLRNPEAECLSLKTSEHLSHFKVVKQSVG